MISAFGVFLLIITNLRTLEEKYGLNMNLYETSPTGRCRVRKSKNKQKQDLNLWVPLGTSRKLETVIENFKIIISPALLTKTFTCDVTPNCGYMTSVKHHFDRHISVCAENSKTKIVFKEKVRF